MRVVFDSNIYISALAISGTTAEKAIIRILEGTDTLLISKPILDEVLSTLARRFSRDPEALSQVAVTLTDMAELVKPQNTIRVLKDDPDNRILECANAGRADLVVTGDKEMLRLKQYPNTRIVSLREYLGKP